MIVFRSQPWGTNKLGGGLDLKYKINEYGLTVTEKLKTDQTVTTDVAIEDYLVKGLKIGAEATLFGTEKSGQVNFFFLFSISPNFLVFFLQ